MITGERGIKKKKLAGSNHKKTSSTQKVNNIIG